MKSQLDLIEADFKLLHSEFKKKNPQIGQSVGTALMWIQQNNQNPEKLMCQPVELLEPLKLLFEAKIVKTNAVAMNSLQRVTQTFAISDPNLVLMILGMLKDASEILIDEMTEIRILQLILTFLDPSKLQMSKEFANLVVLCCSQMFDTKSSAVKSTIQATLKQLFTVILAEFNTVVTQQTPEVLSKASGLLGHSKSQQLIAHYREKVNTKQIYAVLHSMIQKIAFTMMAFENKTTKNSLELMWNFKPSQFSKCVMLDCLMLCLTQSNETFRYFPDIVSIFELQVIPTLEQLLMTKQINSQLGVREMKLAILIINHLSCGFGLLRQILIDADSLTSKCKDGSIKFELNWRGLVAFECLQVAISNPALSQLLSTSSLSIGAPIIIQILESYSKVARAIELAANPENKQTHYSTKLTPKVITNANLETEIPAPTLSQIERIIIESVATFAENLNQTITLTKVKLKRSKDQLDDEQRNKQTLSLCWAPILSILEKLIQLVTDEVCVQLLLRAYVNLISACGTALIFDGRDAILTSLCRECLTIHKEPVKESKTNPPTTQRGKASHAVGSLFGNEKCSVTSRNMQVTRSLLEIANKQHSVLDVKSWSIILETMQKVECVMTEKLQLNGMQKRVQKDKLTFNVDGLQQLINFEELKSKVNDLRSHESTRTNTEEETKGKASRISTFDELSDSLKSHHVITEVLISKIGPTGVTESYLLDSIDHFFINTITFDINSLAGLICALAQLTVGALEHLKYSGQNQFVAGVRSSAIISDKATSGMFMTQTDSEILAQINTFAMSRLVEATLVNVSRIESLWKIIVAHFDILNNCQVLAVRQLTIEALQTIVLEIFAHKKASQRQPAKPTKQMNPDLEQLAHAKKMSKEACSPETETPSVDASRESDEEMEEADDRNEDEEMWADSAWQYTILHPLADQLKSNHNHDKFTVIKGFEKIIQKCGQQIRNEGWRIIIVTISKSLEFESEQTVACGFRCLKLVVNNFIDRLSQENFVTVLNAIHLYASNKTSGNINSNLIAIGMFQNIADYTAKQILKKDGSQDAGFVDAKGSFVDQPRDQKQDVNEINFDAIWEILFKRIESLGSDHRTEVRCTTIHTLENIIMIHGASFATSPSDSTLWRKILMDVLQTMLGLAVDKYAGLHSTEQQTTQKQDSKQRAFPKSQKSFEEASVVKALQQNDAQWEETCKILIQVSCRALKKYFIVMQESHSCKLAGQFYEQLTRQIVSVLSVGSMEACKAVFKCLQDFLSHPTCLHLALIKPEQLYQLLDATIAFLSFEINTKPQSKQVGTSTQDNKNSALKALKMCPIFIETLQKVFNQQTLQTSKSIDEESNSLNEQSEKRKDLRPDPAIFATITQKQLATLVFRLLSQMLAASSNTSDGMSAFGSQQKLLTEEKIVFDFIETLNDFYLGEPDIQQSYIDFLLSFTEYTGNPRFEAVIRRVLQILYNKLLTSRVNPTLITYVVPKVFDRMQVLVDLRYNPDQCHQLIQQAKGQQTLFTTVGLFAILFGSFMINPEQFKSRLGSYVQRIEESKSAGGLSVNSDNDDLMFSESTELITVRPETISTELNQDTQIKQLIWDKIIKLMKSSLLFDMERTREHSKATLQELVKISNDLDMHVVSFIVTCLLPNSSDVQNLPGQDSQRSFEHSLVSIIDQICISSSASASNTSTMSQLSRYCFNNMFDLCRFREDASTEGLSADQQAKVKRHIEVRQKVARIATPILINRCRQTLRKFVTDEIKVGSLSMPRNRINEAVFILESLRTLNCYPQSFSRTDAMPVNPLERAVVTQSLQPLQCSTPNKKGHLIELMPVFADLVMSNEIGLKENLREIFIEISKALLNEKQKQEETRNSEADTK